MQRRRKGKPYNPATAAPVHNRQSTDLLRNARVAPMEVDDPWEKGSKITVARSLRDDPLARLHVRDQIDDAQFYGGRAFQRDFEVAERGPRAIDPSKEAVDGGRVPEPITEDQRKAVQRLNRVYRSLGNNGSTLVHDILIRKQTLDDVCAAYQMTRDLEKRYLGKRFRECLECLAEFYGLTNSLTSNVCGT